MTMAASAASAATANKIVTTASSAKGAVQNGTT